MLNLINIYIFILYIFMNILNNYVFLYELHTLVFFSILLYIFFRLSFYKVCGFIIFIMVFLFYFFRIPDVNPNLTSKYLYAPCYGKIKQITQTNNYLHIVTFINVTDPHIQYFPYSGFLKKIIYKKGEFNPAYMIHKGKDNEKMIYHLDTIRGNIIVSQVAGVLARTIVPFVKENTPVQQNQEIGLIKLGSRCDVFIPLYNNMKVLVKKGDYVKGTFTKIVEFLN